MLKKISQPSFQIFSLVFFVKFTKSDWWKLISVYNNLASYWLVFLHHLNLKRGRVITSTTAQPSWL